MPQVNSISVELHTWGKASSENTLFSRLIWGFLVVTLLFALIVNMITVPELTREQKAKVPPQLTKFIERVKIEEKPKPKPIEEVKKEEPKEKPKPVVEKKIEPVVKPVIKTQEQKVKVALEQAKNSGLLAMQDDLAQLREIAKMTMPNNKQTLSNEGSEATVSTAPILDKFSAKTAILDKSKVSQTIGKRVDLAKRSLTTVADKVLSPQAAAAAQEASSSAIAGGRDVESIRKVLDRNKGAFYTIYRRALRQDPSLEGKVEMLIVVAPNGSVESCSIVSSELNSPALERKLLARVRLINFGAQQVDQTSINYSFNFLPF